MQQQIQQRTQSFTLLSRAEVLSKQWQQKQATSVALLTSMNNILAQHEASNDAAALIAQFKLDPAQLAYKQSLALEECITQLYKLMESWQELVAEWQHLEHDANKYWTKTLTVPSPQGPWPLSNEALIQVTAVRPQDTYDYISRLYTMYKSEYHYKKTLMQQLSQFLTRISDFDDFTERWTAQPHLHPNLPADISERIKLYKTVKKVVESVD
ncbi:uncharacterized protein BYT42DRAFT_553094 [Radiomyces spectabilis]|uniref:uncharacterized protein n=1 Tax=Radiomyces spectabilis TaxID=64574 RepID=UPI00221E57C3|nr:uncharacterized protein BYT42DRAFT_553094 [Radiomyces spectabilis]KAI8394026.1 hypothetical protein BYT42DRAFT_553094 [Radiomyces spectabilis]